MWITVILQLHYIPRNSHPCHDERGLKGISVYKRGKNFVFSKSFTADRVKRIVNNVKAVFLSTLYFLGWDAMRIQSTKVLWRLECEGLRRSKQICNAERVSLFLASVANLLLKVGPFIPRYVEYCRLRSVFKKSKQIICLMSFFKWAYFWKLNIKKLFFTFISTYIDSQYNVSAFYRFLLA